MKSIFRENKGKEITNIPHEILILGYLRQIYGNNDNHNMISNIIDICYNFYVDQTLIHKIDSFVEEKVNELSELLDISTDESMLLLLKHKWNSMIITDKYFNNPSKMLKAAGCFTMDSTVAVNKNIKHQQSQPNVSIECESCDEFNDDIFSLKCGHKVICKNCWIYYLKSSSYSSNCMYLTCPHDLCDTIIPRSIWKKFLFKSYKLYYQQYWSYLRQNCINYNKIFTKCSNISNCNIVYFSFNGIPPNTICTQCRSEFNCSKCGESPHYLLSCDGAEMWRNMEINEGDDNYKTYKYHFKQFLSHLKLLQNAVKEKERINERMHELAEYFSMTLSETTFLYDAINEIIACHKILAWINPIIYQLMMNDTKYSNSNGHELLKQQYATLNKFCDGLQRRLSFDLEKLSDNKVRQEFTGYVACTMKYRKNFTDLIQSEISI